MRRAEAVSLSEDRSVHANGRDGRRGKLRLQDASSYWQLLPTIVPALADDTQPLEHVAIRQSVRPGKNMATADGCADCPGIEH